MPEIGYNREQLYRTNLVTIYTEANPNPQSMKFMLNLMLMPAGESVDFPDAETAQKSPLALELFNFEYVKRVFYMNNFITITKDDAKEWNEIVPELKQFIKTYIESGKPIFPDEHAHEALDTIDTNDTETVKKIKGILDEYIKPAVEMDGGAIRFHSYNEAEGVLKVELQGSCSGCPSSTVTLKAGIENLVKRMVPGVKEVIAEGV
jgi:Fe-S cluster biogenesis protein NfuA